MALKASAQGHTDSVAVVFAGHSPASNGLGVRPNSRQNAVAGVKKALEACREAEDALLVFPKGRYDFWPQHAEERVYYESNSYDNNPKTCAILIESFKGLTIAGTAEEIFASIDAVGNDLDLNRSLTAPTFRVSAMQIGGE